MILLQVRNFLFQCRILERSRADSQMKVCLVSNEMVLRMGEKSSLFGEKNTWAGRTLYCGWVALAKLFAITQPIVGILKVLLFDDARH